MSLLLATIQNLDLDDSYLFNRGEDGNCYQAACIMFMKIGARFCESDDVLDDNLHLCHGLVVARCPGDPHHNQLIHHAWIEVGGVLAIDASRVDKPIFVTPIGHYERLAKASFVQRYCAAQMMEVIKYTVHTGPWIPSAGEAFDPADPECLLKKNQIDRVLEKAGQQVTSREFVECLSKWSMVKTRSKGKRRGKIKK